MAASTGNNTTPFYGCKISLISKSEIRYEGILYTIDPKESTIALAKVRSFGSEDRPVERPVPPRDDIFEFIIFRASDIKDLIVDDPPPAPQSTLSDPAIIQAQHSATSTSFPAAFPASSASGSGAATTSAAQQPQQQPSKAPGQGGKQQSGERHSQADGSKGPSKQTSSSSVTSGQAFAKVAAGLSAAGSSTQPQSQQQPQNKQPGQRQPSLSFSSKLQQGTKNDGQPATGGERNQRPNNQQQLGQHQLTVGGPRGEPGQNGFIRQNRQQNNQQNRVIGETANPNYHRNNNGQQHQGFRSYNANRFVPRNQQGGGGGFVPGGFRRGGYNNGPGGMGNRNFIPRGPMTHTVPKFPPLPDTDFDFEKSAADFKILEEKLCALKLNGALPSSSEGGDAPFELPEVPGIPASALTVAALEEEDISKEPCYNKTKSFFDSISCEALEREKGTNQRVDWKAERKQNRETFGIVAARRPTFYRNNRGGLGGGYHHHGGRGGYHQQRGHFQNRTGGPMNRVPRTPNTNGNPTANSTVTSTTPTSRSSTGGGQPKTTPNGVATTSPAAPVAAKN